MSGYSPEIIRYEWDFVQATSAICTPSRMVYHVPVTYADGTRDYVTMTLAQMTQARHLDSITIEDCVSPPVYRAADVECVQVIRKHAAEYYFNGTIWADKTEKLAPQHFPEPERASLPSRDPLALPEGDDAITVEWRWLEPVEVRR